MIPSSGTGAIHPMGFSKITYNTTEREVHAAPVHSANYDSIRLSSASDGKSRFHKELVSRLSQEVRTATTTGDIRSLRDAVSSGTYTPDPAVIVSRLLYLGEEA